MHASSAKMPCLTLCECVCIHVHFKKKDINICFKSSLGFHPKSIVLEPQSNYVTWFAGIFSSVEIDSGLSVASLFEITMSVYEIMH